MQSHFKCGSSNHEIRNALEKIKIKKLSMATKY